MSLESISISQTIEEDAVRAARAVRDHFLCPDQFLSFQTAAELPCNAGYFKFGPDVICYGLSSRNGSQAQLGSELSDILSEVSIRDAEIILPFDPTEIIDNCRLERYPGSRMGRYEKWLKDIYYQFRPLTNRAVRKRIQRFRATHWETRRFPQWPVDTTVENLQETLLSLSLKVNGVNRIPFIWFWPDGARGCVSITHDVETKAGLDFSMKLADIDDSFGVKASFQLVPEKRYTVTPEFLNSLRAAGFEVCVQDLNHDGRLFDEREEFQRRVALINQYGREYGAKGFRSAVLYRNLEWYQDLDFSFDMTVPNVAPLDPQRGGCCTVMPYFIGNLLELPLTTVQDYTLFHVLNERSIALWRTQMEKILAKNGLATFLVHPDYVIESETQAVYKQLLTMLKEMRKTRELWFALPNEVNSWWRLRSRMSIVSDGSSWRIVGEGAERAVLAFATLVDDRLIYERAGARQQKQNVRELNGNDGQAARRVTWTH